MTTDPADTRRRRLAVLRGAGPLLLLLAGFAASGWLLRLADRQREAAEAADFDRLVANAQAGVEGRLTHYVDLLWGVTSVADALPVLDAAAWSRLEQALDLPGRYPGIHDVMLVRPVRRDAVEPFLAAMRAEVPGSAIRGLAGADPPGAEHFVVTRVAPSLRHQALLGLDLASEISRRRAAEAARDTGQPRITDVLTLARDPRGRPGFVLFVPVYRPGPRPETPEQRRAALQAWLAARFGAESFLSGVLGRRRGRLEMYLFEPGGLDRAHLVHASEPPPDPLPEFARTTPMELAGQAFTVGWRRGPEFARAPRPPVFWAALALAVVTGAVALLCHGLLSARERAEQLAAARTRDLRLGEQALQAALREKDALLEEVHQRVRNTLQVISSLLALESRRPEDLDARGVLRDMQGRVQVMALLHESLHRSTGFGAVDLAAYVRTVATRIYGAQAGRAGAVRLVLELDPVQAAVDQAIPCGLIVNELVSNALEHGFAGGRGGDLRVELRRPAGLRELRLRVSDTGAGLPADFADRRARSLGLQLVADLAAQLGGRLVVGPGPDAAFEVLFEAREPAAAG